MAVPPGGPMEVVFSFDTTGSMSQVLDEVKGRVNDIVQRLQADIPGFKVGIIAHGDYCDLEHFYDIRTLDLTENVVDVVTFVTNTEGTGGGDIPECYELALRRACQMSWTPGSRRVLVVIGDAYPHGPDYEMNKDNIDWTEELKTLVEKDVKIYGVQVQEDPDSTSFFEKLSDDSGGQHLKLANMGTICQVIMGICYREQGAEMFLNYEAELRAKQGRAIGADLENVLGTLRRDDSVQSVKSVAGAAPLDNGDDIVDAAPVDDQMSSSASEFDSSDDENDSGIGDVGTPSTSKKGHKLGKKGRLMKGAGTSAKTPKQTNVKQMTKAQKASPNKKQQRLPKTKTTNGRKVGAKRGKTTQAQLTRPKRECISAHRFSHKNLSWSQWQPAVVPAVGDLTGQWKTVSQSRSPCYWRSDLLKMCRSKLDKQPGCATLFEVGIQSPKTREIKVVYLKSTKANHEREGGVFRLPWYVGMFRSIRKQLNEAVQAEKYLVEKEDLLKVYVRWALVDKDQSNTVKRNILREYDYAWNLGRPAYGMTFHKVHPRMQ